MTREDHNDLAKRLRKLAWPLAFRWARTAKCSVDDILNEAFLVTALKGGLENAPSPEATYLLAVGYVGQRSRRFLSRFQSFDELETSECETIKSLMDLDDPYSNLQREELITDMVAELQCLPRREREVLELHLQNLTLAQIADRTAQPMGTVASDYERAKKRLASSGRLRAIVERLSAFPALLWDWAKPNYKSAMAYSAVVGCGVVAAAWVMSPESDSQYPSMGARTTLTTHLPVKRAEEATTVEVREPRGASVEVADAGEAPHDLTTATPTAILAQTLGRQPLRFNPSANSGSPIDPAAERWTNLPDLSNWWGSDPTLEYRESFWPGTTVAKQRWSERDGKKEGLVLSFRRDGTLSHVSERVDGRVHGRCWDYDESGMKVRRVHLFESELRIATKEIE